MLVNLCHGSGNHKASKHSRDIDVLCGFARIRCRLYSSFLRINQCPAGGAKHRYRRLEMEKIVVTRHPNVVQWLIKHGHVDADVRVIEHANYAHIKDKEVFGILPMFLAHAAACVHHIDLNRQIGRAHV